MHFHWLPPSHPAHPQVFVTHLRGEELGKILLMTKRFQWGSTKCGKLSLFNTNLKQKKSERLSKKEIFLLLSSCLFFVPFLRSLISWVAPLSSPPWLSARPEQSLGILEFPLCSCPWLTYLFNYFTVCLLFKWRGPCCFFPSALLFKTQAFHVGPGLPGLMAVTSTFDLPWPPSRIW